MKDSTEQTHFIEKAKKVLEELRRRPKPESLYIQLLVQNLGWMELTAYACCFSKEADLLSQWCRYADDGSGFAVGFSVEWVKQQRRKYLPKHAMELLEVEYDEERQRELATNCIRRYLGQVVGLDIFDSLGRQAIGMWWIGHLWGALAACKHPGFQEEKEVRLILAEITNPDFETEATRKTVGVSPIHHCLSGEQSIPYFMFLKMPSRRYALGRRTMQEKTAAPLRSSCKVTATIVDESESCHQKCPTDRTSEWKP